MDIEEVKLVVQEINDFIKSGLWFDFEIKQYLDGELSLHGGLSLSYPDIEIKFKDIFFVSLPMMWKTDTKETILNILEGEAEREISEKFQVEYLHYIFKFTPEDYPSNFGCIIAAKEISYNILKE
ncbi:hypothetical protein [Cytobacillus purgationiresistens]|uniref:Uncharacterized protein n=1 Tax=Cytobacillus purgationiresistens TaxID=863449 RepID=A0ABU0AJ85_9BACI|nr:hypothetical protein [Cytobacillus purgationiresistens]MDQ0271329.1 hypothetical protein [Cytobacillus purgationiresistens]